MYFALKLLHLTTVALSLFLFLLRGVWMLRDSPLLAARWVRIVPHAVDTVLLGSALVLAWMLRLTPGAEIGRASCRERVWYYV